jgi:hypothetical protein
MKTRVISALAAAFLMTVGTARATHVWEDSAGWWDEHFQSERDVPRYNGGELSLDMFGSYIGPEHRFDKLLHSDIRHGYGGGGAGLNYFFTSLLGAGADFNASAKPGNDQSFDDVLGHVDLRLPLWNTGLAPYISGMGGRGMSPTWQWVYGGGVGLEYRFNPLTGIFAEARYLWSNESTALNSLTLRVGLRLVF